MSLRAEPSRKSPRGLALLLLSVLPACQPAPAAGLIAQQPAPLASGEAPAAPAAAGSWMPVQSKTWGCREPGSGKEWRVPFTGAPIGPRRADSDLGAELSKLLPALDECRLRAQTERLDLGGRLWFEVTLASNGDLERLCTSAEGTMAPGVAACLTNALVELRRPISPYGTRILSVIEPAGLGALRSRATSLPRRCDRGAPGKRQGPLAPLAVEAGGVASSLNASEPQILRAGESSGLAEAESCYAEALARDPRMSGQLSFTVHVDRQGNVSEACHEGSGLDEQARACVAAGLRRIRFHPPSSAGASASGIFWFESRHSDWAWPATRTNLFEVDSYHRGQPVQLPSVGDGDTPAPPPDPPAPGPGGRPSPIRLPGKK